MWDYFKSVNQILQAIIWGSIVASMLALAGAIIYRLVKYGIKIKAGVVEIDASEENETAVKK
jgi:hypothetical protein